jgi:hypothetical protein
MDLTKKDFLQETDLVMPGIRPGNLQVGGRYRDVPVTGDVYMICDRVQQEFGDLILIRGVEDTAKGELAYAILERTSTGEKLVYMTKALDERIITNIKYLLAVPFEDRLAHAEKLEAKAEKEQKDDEFEKLYEELGGPMLRQLEHDGFIETRGTSYPKLGVATHGKRAR